MGGLVHIIQFVFGILGNAATLFLFLVPTFTFKRIIKNKSTEQFSGIPYVMTFLNCLLSAWYGLPFITSGNILVATINGAGASIELVYVLIFFLYAPNKQKGKILAMFFLVLLAFAGAALVSVLAFHGKNRKLFCGTVATIFSIVMYASPMSIIRLVIRTKSVEFMPFFLSFAVVISCSCWFIYAMLGMDPFIGTSTGVGLGLGIVQLILYFIYCDKKVLNKTSADVPLEMGNGHSNNVRCCQDYEKQSNYHNQLNHELV
ncbi:bidirectional sugar transporter SWEET1-like [Lycium ferocissimum]|uniref:bidirectional sugar transporter SWEET1-like n=1 Tax=Lycium ferocissimum TaxID=112874 RepID=UPI0028162F14|nr:bidirectional sugar transporter SWEET1-like [Lycium ferocissimum]XP_059289627.1 bidirectional sugar transporter SWEET1-like [Lycium ferocissimum]